MKNLPTSQKDLSLSHNGLELSQKDEEILDSLKPEIDSQTSFFIRHFMLMEAERIDQSCQLFLPLLNVLLKDQEATRILRNQDEKTYQSITKAINNYNIYHSQLASHLQDFGRDLKRQGPLFKQQQSKTESKERLTLPKPTQKNKKQVAVSTTDLTPKFQTNVPKPREHQRRKPSNFSQTSTNSTQINTPEANNEITEWLMSRSSPQEQSVSGKKEYRTPSEQEQKEARKTKAKLEKRERAQTQYQETLETQQKDHEIKHQLKENVNPVTFNISGGYDTFESIMNGSYKGEMGAIANLIKTRFGGMAYLSHGRWHFALPHIANNQNTVFTTTLDPLMEEHDDDVEESVVSISTAISTNQQRSAIVVHNPHKNHSKRLRFYHVDDIKKLFEQGGYTLETVKEERITINNNSKK